MYNKVTLIGNLGKDAEVKRLENGTVVASFSLATTKKWKDNTGAWQEKAQWHNIVLWRELAERADALKKGMQVFVEGEIEYRKYTAQDGTEKFSTDINASIVRMLGAKPAAANAQAATQAAPTPAPAPPPKPVTDDLPF